MSKIVASLKESQLRSLDRWAMLTVALMGLGPLVPFAIAAS